MRAARAVMMLTVVALPAGVLAGAEPPSEPRDEPPEEPRRPPAPPELDALLGAAGDEGSAVVYGHGAILEARVGDDQSEAVVSVRTERGWYTHALGYGLFNGTHYTVEELRLVDVVGDAEPELWLEVRSDRDPCACDDGPSFADSEITICKVTQRGLTCSAPVQVYSYAHVLEEETWSASLTVSRRGVARLRSSTGRVRNFLLFR